MQESAIDFLGEDLNIFLQCDIFVNVWHKTITVDFWKKDVYSGSVGNGGGNTMTEVVAALIWDAGKFMICQRPAHKARGLLWEFVGGKVEQGESKEEALIRECWEELEVMVSVKDVFMEVTHEYPDLTVHLTLFNASIVEGTPKLIEHNAIAWIIPEEIPNFDFCPADEEILKKISKI